MDTQAKTNPEKICCCGPVLSSTYPDEDWYQDMGCPAHGDTPEEEWICLTDLMQQGPFRKRPRLLPPHVKTFIFVHINSKETEDTTEESDTEESDTEESDTEESDTEESDTEEEPEVLEFNESEDSDSETIPEPHPKKRFLQRFLQEQ